MPKFNRFVATGALLAIVSTATPAFAGTDALVQVMVRREVLFAVLCFVITAASMVAYTVSKGQALITALSLGLFVASVTGMVLAVEALSVGAGWKAVSVAVLCIPTSLAGALAVKPKWFYGSTGSTLLLLATFFAMVW